MTEVPKDLVPLPTAPYDERPTSIPLDVEECRTAIWLERGNISKAAERLKVPSSRLRGFVKKSPRLLSEVEEAREILCDVAEDNVYDALVSDDEIRRDTMSKYVLTNLGKDRGYGNGTGKGVTINNRAGGTVVVGWADGSSFNDDPSREIDHHG